MGAWRRSWGGGQKEDETERLRDFKSHQGSVSRTQREQRMALTTGGMSFPLISCNRNGVIRGGEGVGGGGGCCGSGQEHQTFPRAVNL